MTSEEKDARIRELENDLVKEARVRYSNEIALYAKLRSAEDEIKWAANVAPLAVRARLAQWLERQS